ncbi:hypothetical protein [Catellatospora citrea]|uniref:Uncharacterized protein n=1 Tax=Catellatospora citrea TaxID=53366 RepID=A0A8J3KJW4_9ACTN|nr:hypothetical protein [Catellatospora citrea]RKE11034.1 hypothetical protein C8E86_5954 [Catellatospora citrea]GIF96489.1 hypothetical protein Cci01nite_15830 [Catellatospora citrea]
MNDADVLGAFREDPLPPSGVNVARAVRTGRRQRRVRTAGAAGALALLLAGSAAVPAWFSAANGPANLGASPEVTVGPPPPACPSPEPTPSVSPPALPPGTAPGAFDVMRRWVDVSAVSDLHVQQFNTGRYWQYVTLYDAQERITVEVIVYASQGKPVFGAPESRDFGPVDLTGAESAGQVAGKPASWLPARQGMAGLHAARLGWQWAEGGWAFVAAADNAQDPGLEPSAEAMAALRVRAAQVAGALVIGRGPAVTMPFTVSSVPECSRLTGTSYYLGTHANGTPFVRAGLVFSRVDNTDPLLFPPDVVTSVIADSVATPADKPGSVNEQVDGRPAVVGNGFVMLHGLDGFALEVNAPLGRDALIAYARTVRIVEGAHGDESKWTDRPIRQ